MKIKNALVMGALVFGAYQMGTILAYLRVIKVLTDDWNNHKKDRIYYHHYEDAYKSRTY